MPLFLDACPSFSERWSKHQAFYGDDDLLYMQLGEFAHHLVDLKKDKLTEEFPAVFALIERLHLEGDEYVSNAMTIGLLEGLQNISVNPAEFKQYLLPESKAQWHKLNSFWNGDANALQEEGNKHE